jgi:hypothetical protein
LDCASFFDNPVVQTRHSGSTITSFDYNNDGLSDLVLGDISYDGLVYLENGGTLGNAWMNDQNIRFSPGIEPISIQIFNSVFLEDVTNDGISEFLVMPNDPFSAQTENHIWRFDATEESGNLQWELQTKNYLIEDMINTGRNSAPLFIDYNSDGLMDLLIGSFTFGGGLSGIQPSLVLYENTGTAQDPEFVLSNDDFLSMRDFAETSIHFAPALGDLDGDGDEDMVIGDDRGRLYWIENISVTHTGYEFADPAYDVFGIKVSAWAKPDIFDVNQDGLGDLVIGEQNFNSEGGRRGSLNYFENIGTIGNPVFEPDILVAPNDGFWGKVFIRESGFINNHSAPRIIKGSDTNFLIVGSESGLIQPFEFDVESPQDSFLRLESPLTELYEGVRSMFDLADLDGDNVYEIAIGTRRGGLAIYHTDLPVGQTVPTNDVIMNEGLLSVWPNPSRGTIWLQLDTQDRTVYTQIVSSDGRELKQFLLEGNEKGLVQSADLLPGLYLIIARSGNSIDIDKVVIH